MSYSRFCNSKMDQFFIKYSVVINQKLCDVCVQKLVWMVSTIGTTNTPSFIKIREVTQNSLLILHEMTRRRSDILLLYVSFIVKLLLTFCLHRLFVVPIVLQQDLLSSNNNINEGDCNYVLL